MKTYSITEGAFPHARTSIAHYRARSNRKLNPDGRTDPRSRDARGTQTGYQATRRSNALLSSLWAEAAQTGGNRAPSHRHDLRTRGGSATAFSLPGVLAALGSSQ